MAKTGTFTNLDGWYRYSRTSSQDDPRYSAMTSVLLSRFVTSFLPSGGFAAHAPILLAT